MTEQANGQQRGRDGYVYLVRAASGEHKIGWSKDPRARLSSLASGSPFPLELVHQIPSDDGAWAESLLHAKYAEYRVHGEWFRLPQEAVAKITSIRQPINRPDWNKPRRLESLQWTRETITATVHSLDRKTGEWQCTRADGVIVCVQAPDGSGWEFVWKRDRWFSAKHGAIGKWEAQPFGLVPTFSASKDAELPRVPCGQCFEQIGVSSNDCPACGEATRPVRT